MCVISRHEQDLCGSIHRIGAIMMVPVEPFDGDTQFTITIQSDMSGSFGDPMKPIVPIATIVPVTPLVTMAAMVLHL